MLLAVHNIWKIFFCLNETAPKRASHAYILCKCTQSTLSIEYLYRYMNSVDVNISLRLFSASIRYSVSCSVRGFFASGGFIVCWPHMLCTPYIDVGADAIYDRYFSPLSLIFWYLLQIGTVEHHFDITEYYWNDKETKWSIY